jgi:hypothetical protein
MQCLTCAYAKLQLRASRYEGPHKYIKNFVVWVGFEVLLVASFTQSSLHTNARKCLHPHQFHVCF